MILGLLPITAISLPFISYGLTPTVFHALIMGIVLSVYRRKDIPARKSAKTNHLVPIFLGCRWFYLLNKFFRSQLLRMNLEFVYLLLIVIEVQKLFALF